MKPGVTMIRLSRKIFSQVLLRSFTLQASWNYEQMQGLGLLFTLAPALRRFYPEDQLLAAYRRHLQYFNTHPYLASALIGAVLKLERQAAEGEAQEIGINEFKSAVAAPCAAMGDGFFWGALRPVAAVAGLFLTFRGSAWGSLLFLFLFNIPHLLLRTVGLKKGYERGFRIVENIQRCRFPDLSLRLKQLLIILLGILAAGLIKGRFDDFGWAPGWELAAIPFVVLLGFLVRKRFSPLVLLFLMLLGLLICYQWV